MNEFLEILQYMNAAGSNRKQLFSRQASLRSVRILLPVTDIDYFMRVVLTERQRQRPDALETALVGLFQDMLEEIRCASPRYG
jgi:hypothetical protein